MQIKYVGHSCFKISDSETAYSIVFDPYADAAVPGYTNVRESANEVLCSHQHDDHNAVECVTIEPNTDSPFEIDWIDTYHDPEKGALRGENRIYIVTNKKTGEKLIHYGDIGEVLDVLLTDENLAKLKDADLALIPCGGVFTYDIDEALELISRTTPKLVIPMHARSEKSGYDYPVIDTRENFFKAAKDKGYSLIIDEGSLADSEQALGKSDILALEPTNI